MTKFLRAALISALLLVGVDALAASRVVPEVRLGGTLSTGGRWGMTGIADAGATRQFRALGGRLYVHELGWAKTSKADRSAIVRLFPTPPVWESALPIDHPRIIIHDWVHPLWPEPVPATCLNSDPNAEQMRLISTSLKGLSWRTGAFGTPNYAAPAAPFASSTFDDLRKGALTGRALCLDLPPDYYFGREVAYRDWVEAAIRWSKSNGVRTVIAIYPRVPTFPADTMRMVRDLERRGAVPDIYAGDVYASKASNLYPLGAETDPNTLTSVMLQLLQYVRGG